jgi:hypothetical protein
MDDVAVEKVFSRNLFGFFLIITILPLLHTRASSSLVIFDSLNQVAHYHNIGVNVWGFIYDPALGWLQSKEVFCYMLYQRTRLCIILILWEISVIITWYMIYNIYHCILIYINIFTF